MTNINSSASLNQGQLASFLYTEEHLLRIYNKTNFDNHKIDSIDPFLQSDSNTQPIFNSPLTIFEQHCYQTGELSKKYSGRHTKEKDNHAEITAFKTFKKDVQVVNDNNNKHLLNSQPDLENTSNGQIISNTNRKTSLESNNTSILLEAKGELGTKSNPIEILDQPPSYINKESNHVSETLIDDLIHLKLEDTLEKEAKARWYYIDDCKNIQGPFDGEVMQAWHKKGYFAQDLLIREECDKDFRPLKTMFQNYGTDLFNMSHRRFGDELLKQLPGDEQVVTVEQIQAPQFSNSRNSMHWNNEAELSPYTQHVSKLAEPQIIESTSIKNEKFEDIEGWLVASSHSRNKLTSSLKPKDNRSKIINNTPATPKAHINTSSKIAFKPKEPIIFDNNPIKKQNLLGEYLSKNINTDKEKPSPTKSMWAKLPVSSHNIPNINNGFVQVPTAWKTHKPNITKDSQKSDRIYSVKHKPWNSEEEEVVVIKTQHNTTNPVDGELYAWCKGVLASVVARGLNVDKLYKLMMSFPIDPPYTFYEVVKQTIRQYESPIKSHTINIDWFTSQFVSKRKEAAASKNAPSTWTRLAKNNTFGVFADDDD